MIDGLLRDEQQILNTTNDPRQAFDLLIAGQVEFVVADRSLPRSTTARSTTCPKRIAADSAVSSGYISKNGAPGQ